MKPDLNFHRGHFRSAVLRAKIRKPLKPLTVEQVRVRRTRYIQRIAEETQLIKDYSRFNIEGLCLEDIIELVTPRLIASEPCPISAPIQTVIPLAIQGIYQDLDDYAANQQFREREINIIWGALFGHQELPSWYPCALTRAGHAMLGYLIRTRTFLHAAVDMDTSMFSILLDILVENKPSLIIFARVRMGRIEDVNAKSRPYGDQFSGIVVRHDKHAYVVPKSGFTHTKTKSHIPADEVTEVIEFTVQPTFVKTIEENIFDPVDFRLFSSPSGWPDNFKWPSNPGVRQINTKCHLCQSQQLCDCAPAAVDSGESLVEIHDYGPKGRGIRTLQQFRKGDVLAEYTGRFLHPTADIDTIYAIEFRNDPHVEDGDSIALLDASSEGNWTRFINHACENANVRFHTRDIGKYRRIVVEAIEDINVYQELTIDYGGNYWTGANRICLCGSASCHAPPEIETNDVTQRADASRKRVYLMDDDHHSDGEYSASNPRVIKSFRTITKGSRGGRTNGAGKKVPTITRAELSAELKNDEEMATAVEQIVEERRKRHEKAIWYRRWIGQENKERPRQKTKRKGDNYFTQF